MFTSNVTVAAPWDRWDSVALALAVFTAVWVFALKLKTFYDLGYSGDLFVSYSACSKLARGAGFTPGQLLWELCLLFTPIFCFSRSDL